MTEPGRPAYPEEQYQKWLDEMQPFLRQGCTLWYAMDKCQLLTHNFTIYEKYRLGDWFSQKVDAYRRTIGELANNITFKVLDRLNSKMVEGATEMSREELEVLKLVAEKHRSAQPFFVTRTETAEARPEDIGKILDNMDGGVKSDYGTLGPEIAKQSVETNPPVQNQEQVGADSNVSA